MLDLGLANITMFFVLIGICLIFIVTWIIKSEARMNVCKDEIKKLKSDLDSSDRERFVLSEKLANAASAPAPEPVAVPDENAAAEIDALKTENKKLKKDLAEAKASLQEVYKALS